MRRRDVITLIGGAAASWPLTARAQQPERMRRIGVLMSTGADDPEGRARIAAFLDGLQRLGWTDGLNSKIDIRWPNGATVGVCIAAVEMLGGREQSSFLPRQPKLPTRSYTTAKIKMVEIGKYAVCPLLFGQVGLT